MLETNLTQEEFESSFTFDNFIVRDTNRFAHAASLVIAENSAYNPLVIYGPTDTGKTHLVLAIKNHIKKKHPNKKVDYVQGEKINKKIIEDVKNKCCDVDVLIVDDLHLIADEKSVKKEIFNLIEELYKKNKQIIVTLDRDIWQIKTLDEKIKSCLLNGLFADIVPSDFKTEEILKHQA